MECFYCEKKIDTLKEYYPVFLGVAVSTPETFTRYCCRNCMGVHLSQCSHCGNMYAKKDIRKGLCGHCINSAHGRFIKNYSFKVEREISIIGKSQDSIFYGVELEFESENIGEDTLTIHSIIRKFACLKRDSSIERGFEIVSAPCSLDSHREIWLRMFSEMPHTVKVQKTCGMHVHATRERFTDLQIGKMISFIHHKDNREFIKMIAGRPSSYHNNYEVNKTILHGKNGGIIDANSDRHTALNLLGEKTIEFRIFKSTKKLDIFLKNIEFCKALIKFTHPGMTSINESLNYKNFIHFTKLWRRDFPHLHRFVQKNAPFINKKK